MGKGPPLLQKKGMMDSAAIDAAAPPGLPCYYCGHHESEDHVLML